MNTPLTDLAEHIATYHPPTLTGALPLVIPEEAYAVLTCYKDEPDYKVLMVEDGAGERFILKAAANHRRETLKSEYDLLMHLRYPHFPRCFRYFERNGQAFLLREYIPGKTLAAYAEERKLFPDEIVQWTVKACEIISILHRQNPPIIHRDIKPQNFIVTPDRQLVMIDLDSVQRYAPDKGMDTVFMGTPATAAPEQFGARRSDMRADVYGVGMLMLYLLTNDVDVKSLKRIPRPLWLRRTILRCTSFDPDARYASIARLLLVLRAANSRRWRAARIAVCCMAAAVLCAGVVYLTTAIRQPTYVASSHAAERLASFTEPLIEKAVAYQLGKEPGTITWGDLKTVHTLYLCGDTPFDQWDHVACFHRGNTNITGIPEDAVQDGSIVSLADLAMMPNLRKLALYRQNISDISTLEGLPLTHLGLGENPIRDFSVLKKLPTLLAVDLGATGFLDASLLAECRALQIVHLGDTPVYDLHPLTGLPIYELFVFFDAVISDPEVLEAFSELICLKTHNVPSWGIEVIGRLDQLEILDLGGSYLGSLDAIADLTSLRQLFANHSDLTSLDGIERMTRLNTLWIAASEVKDLSPISTLPLLFDLDISNTQLDNYTQLQSLPELSVLYISKDQAEMVSALGLLSRVEVLTR